jgi:hypothetical protein
MFRSILVALIGLIMMGLTVIGYTASARFLFAGGSTESMMTIAAPSAIVSTVFLALCVVLYLLRKRMSRSIRWPLLGIAVILWFISGRTIGLAAFPDGRVSTGWFFIETNRFNLCQASEDCETVIGSEMQTAPSSLWRLDLSTGHVSETIFVGPFLWGQSKTLFRVGCPNPASHARV